MAGIGLSRLVGGGSEIYGTKPKVPGAIDYTKDIEQAITSNKNILPELSAFAKLSTEEMANLLEISFPGYKNTRDTISGNINSMVHGEVPADVQRQLEQQAAERGQTLGYGGSQFGDNQFLRNFGITSLQLTQQGLDSATKWIGQAQNTTLDFSKFFLNKEDAMRKTEFNWQRDWLAAQVKAAPNPAARGEFDSEMTAIGMNLSAYAGGQGYTGTYRPQYQSPVPKDSGFGPGPAYGSTYQGAGGNTYISVPTDTQGGGMSVPYNQPYQPYSPGGAGGTAPDPWDDFG